MWDGTKGEGEGEGDEGMGRDGKQGKRERGKDDTYPQYPRQLKIKILLPDTRDLRQRLAIRIRCGGHSGSDVVFLSLDLSSQDV